MATSRIGGPNGASASKRIELGALTRRTPRRRWRSRPLVRAMSARARRSVNSLERSARSASARRASSPPGSWGGTVAHAAPSASSKRRRRLLRGLWATLDPALAVLEVVDLLLDPVGGRIELQGLLPRGEGVVVEAVLDERISKVLVDHWIRFLGFRHRAFELLQSLGISSLLVVRPAETVDEVAVLGLQIERLGDELDRLVEVLAALGIHVADVVVSLGVPRIERDHAPEGPDRVIEPRLLLVDDAELEVEVLLFVVEPQALQERFARSLVLLGAVVRRPEVAE